ncbi:MAG: hypothetical protein KatS3mg082_3006 [Nitrospiraceae bacterium]|nr:MAG: hypothetical protein KatS3mg082_3006 [Nitrospiraceae bacterium]
MGEGSIVPAQGSGRPSHERADASTNGSALVEWVRARMRGRENVGTVELGRFALAWAHDPDAGQRHEEPRNADATLEALAARVRAEIRRQVGSEQVWPAWRFKAKRLVDVVAASLGLIISAPLWLLIALAIKLESGGPVLFRQVRLGHLGRPFTILKFRTMKPDADREKVRLIGANQYRDPRFFKLPDDPRVTRVGRWLRRTSLDELPQLVNVLRGEMSLVGPRPPVPQEVEHYRGREFLRLAVRPGITGRWQVSGRNSVRSFDEVVALGLQYVLGWSPTEEIRILLRTIPVVLKGHGAM